MIVEFVHSPKEYDLHGVPEHHFHGLINAESAGRYWNEYLKNLLKNAPPPEIPGRRTTGTVSTNK